MDYGSTRRQDFVSSHLGATQDDALDGYLPPFVVAQVVDINDPEKLNRIRVRFHWQREGEQKQASAWIKQGTLHVGPTDSRRGVVWGIDLPMPEVHSDVFVFFNGGNPHDGYHFGAPRYRENERTVPRVEKDDKKQFCFRWRFPNGTEFGVGTEGDAYAIINGHLRVKVQGNLHMSARGAMTMIATRIVQGALSVIRRIAATFSDAQYIRAADDPELRDMFVDAMDGVPGKADPGIREPEDLQ